MIWGTLIMDWEPKVGELLQVPVGRFCGRVVSVKPLPGGEWSVVVETLSEAELEGLSSLPLTAWL